MSLTYYDVIEALTPPVEFLPGTDRDRALSPEDTTLFEALARRIPWEYGRDPILPLGPLKG